VLQTKIIAITLTIIGTRLQSANQISFVISIEIKFGKQIQNVPGLVKPPKFLTHLDLGTILI